MKKFKVEYRNEITGNIWDTMFDTIPADTEKEAIELAKQWFIDNGEDADEVENDWLFRVDYNGFNYLKFITKVEQLTPCRWFYHVGDNFTIEISITEHDKKYRNDLMNLWVKHGFIDRFLPTHICVHTYHTDVNGNCNGKYNIQHTKDGKINFDYIMEYTEENVDLLLNECIRMYEMNI